MSQMHTLELKRLRGNIRAWRKAHLVPPPFELPPDKRTGAHAPAPGASSPTHLEAYAWQGATGREPWVRVFAIKDRSPAGPPRRVKIRGKFKALFYRDPLAIQAARIITKKTKKPEEPAK
jgi:hypothetical protein